MFPGLLSFDVPLHCQHTVREVECIISGDLVSEWAAKPGFVDVGLSDADLGHFWVTSLEVGLVVEFFRVYE